MTDFDHALDQIAPPASEYCRLRREAGWGDLPIEIAERALAKGLLNATVRIGDDVVGFGRAVGDGVMYFYVCDIIVDSRFRRRGISRRIIESLIQQVREAAPQGATLALMSAGGVETLYEEFGFTRRPAGTLGAGMTLFMGPLT